MDIIQTCVVVAIILLAMWRRDIFFYLMATPAAIVMGLLWRNTFGGSVGLVVSAALVGIGLYCLIMAIYNIVRTLR